MNLCMFLEEIDKLTETMSKTELKAFVHENGRKLPETFREEYLSVLFQFSNGADHKMIAENSDKDLEFRKKYENLKERIDLISSGELCLGGVLNYEYDDWYNSDVEEFILSDPNGVVDIIDEACEYVHRCIDHEEYQFGYQIAELLIHLEISAEIEDGYEFYNTLGIYNLGQYDLGNIDSRRMVIDGLYCAYHAAEMEDRAHVLYDMIENSGLHDIYLEMVMQNGEELEDIHVFLPVWIAYLGEKLGKNAQRLLNEALELGGREELVLESARLYSHLHPVLYEQYLDGMCARRAECEDIFKIGNESLEKIEKNYRVRSRIAKKMSLLALQQGFQKQAEVYWLEAFRSDTNVTNFMRLYIESRDNKNYLGEVRKIYRKMFEGVDRQGFSFTRDSDAETNRADVDNTYMLAFFGGEFRYIREQVMNVTNALGWSSTFMKCGLAAFLLLLYDSDTLQAAGKEMCRRIVCAVKFDKEDYEKYADRRIESEQDAFFWQCFMKWKEKNVVDEAEKQEMIGWLDKLIRKRVSGIMEANRRNYYGECASYIAAFGEMLESKGGIGAKQRIMSEYKSLYSRRRSFCQELRNFGMIDTRKRK